MRHVCLFIVLLGCGLCHERDKNDKWRLNDILIMHIDHFYHHFAITVEDAQDRSKRFSSVLSLAMSIYASSNITDPAERVDEAVLQTRRRLYQPADLISALMRSRLTLFRSILDPPINDVQNSCPPEIKQKPCLTALKKYHEENERKCPGYKRHVEFYEKVIDKRTSGYRNAFLEAFEEARSSGGDEEAIDFFVQISLVKFPKLFEYINSVYQSLSKETFPCDALRLFSS